MLCHGRKKNPDLKYMDLECLIVVDANAKLILTVGIAFPPGQGEPVFECILVTPTDGEFSRELVFFELFARWSTLYYGYTRRLRSDHFPVSEKKMRQGLFGQTIVVGKIENDWLINPADIRIGAVKGVYPVNFWREQALSRLRGIGLQLPRRLGAAGSLHVLNESDQTEVAHENPQFRKYLHFGAEECG
jgi:hypothetical protein